MIILSIFVYFHIYLVIYFCLFFLYHFIFPYYFPFCFSLYPRFIASTFKGDKVTRQQTFLCWCYGFVLNSTYLFLCLKHFCFFLGFPGSFGPDDCCFQFFSKRLPKNRVMTYQYTDERCTNKAVLFTMRNHAKICVNPSEQWVKSIIETKQWIHIKTGNSSASEPSEWSSVCFITTS